MCDIKISVAANLANLISMLQSTLLDLADGTTEIPGLAGNSMTYMTNSGFKHTDLIFEYNP